VNLRVGFPLIDVLGSVAEPSVYLAKSLVFVGVSRCALEAMSCAVPCVIAGDEGMLGALSFANISLAEQTNFCARGCGKISDGALEREISKLLLLGGEEYERLGRFLRRYVQEKHGIERMAERTEAFYIRARGEVSFGRGACLCGYYGYGNLGDDTLLECAILRAKKRFGEDSVSVLANAPVAEKYRRGVRCVSRKNVFSVIREIYSSHHLIFGGGTLFQDKTSMRSFLYYAAIAYIARLFGVRVEFWGAGFAPLEHRISRKLLSKTLAFADYIELRDRDSLEVVLSLGAPRGKCYLSRDMAFDIPRPRATVEKREGGYAFIAICGRQPRRSHAKIFIRAVGLMCEGKKIIVLGMYPREDREEGQRIARRLGARYVEAESAARLIGLLRRADVCCSERLHLLIFSAIAGVRFEGFGEDRKILSFCEEWGGRYCGGALR
jgi:polysaccharide pyruvyl transferase CsaB